MYKTYLESEKVLKKRILYNFLRKSNNFINSSCKVDLINLKDWKNNYLNSDKEFINCNKIYINNYFKKYINNTIYICDICSENVYSTKKYNLNCNHSICINCYNKLRPNNLKQILCPYCRNVQEENVINLFESANELIEDMIEDHENMPYYIFNCCLIGGILMVMLIFIYLKYFLETNQFGNSNGNQSSKYIQTNNNNNYYNSYDTLSLLYF